jgi:hypothetical protein
VHADGSMSRDVHMLAGVGGLTFTRVAALAEEKGHPRPIPRPGPIQVMGRASHLELYALLSYLQCPEHTVDSICVSCARTQGRELPNSHANDSLSCDNDEDRRRTLGDARIETCRVWL